MARNVVKIKLDIIFKKLFTENVTMLKNFLCDILDIPIGKVKSIQVLNGEIQPEDIQGKQVRLDIKIQMDDRIIDVEMQMQDKGDFKDRILYYWAKIFSEQLKKGENYKDLNQTIAINILNYDLFDCKEPYSTFKLLETERHELLTDKCILLFFELTKVNKNVDKKDRKKLWLQLINAETEEDLIMIEKAGVPEINQAVDFIYKMSENEKIKEMAEAREAYLRDQRNAFYYYEEKGIEKGRLVGKQEGIQEGKLEGRLECLEDVLELMRKEGASESLIQATLDLKNKKK